MFLRTLCEGLSIHGKNYDFKIVTANNGRQAIDILNSTEIDLVITDLRMPEIDGFKLIAYISSKFKDLPVMVMTAYGSYNIEMEIRDKGILHYIEKPIDFEDLLKKILSELKAERRGRVKGMNLATFLQIIGMEKISYTLTVTRGKDFGNLYIKDGELIHAETKNKKGMEAAMDIITWDGVTIDLIDNCNFKGNTINMALENILLQAYKTKDELENRKKKLNKRKNEKQINLVDSEKINEIINFINSNYNSSIKSLNIFSLLDKKIITGWNINNELCGIYGDIVNNLDNILDECGFPDIDKYFLIRFRNDHLIYIFPLGDIACLIQINDINVPLGFIIEMFTSKLSNTNLKKDYQ
ncbi:MAG: hypothetical protein APR63_05550 [Desulfuromonas sp. SDB]|nr:MAG: hypothetical protein APR63_05550 [Desulfuromonas sp. SDB]